MPGITLGRMGMLVRNFREFVAALAARRVEYLLIGGFAVAVQDLADIENLTSQTEVGKGRTTP